MTAQLYNIGRFVRVFADGEQIADLSLTRTREIKKAANLALARWRLKKARRGWRKCDWGWECQVVFDNAR